MTKTSWILAVLLALTFILFGWFYRWASHQSHIAFALGVAAGESVSIPSIHWSLENGDMTPMRNILCYAEEKLENQIASYGESIYVEAANLTIEGAIAASRSYKESNPIDECFAEGGSYSSSEVPDLTLSEDLF